MQLQSHLDAAGSVVPLIAIPAELLILIFNSLPSLSSVLALAATCRRLRGIWHDNVAVIYTPVAARSIPCEKYARQLCVDQGGTVAGLSKMSAQDVHRILRNSHIVESAIAQVEKEIVCKVKSVLSPLHDFLIQYLNNGRGKCKEIQC